jgi:hypothetical protein
MHGGFLRGLEVCRTPPRERPQMVISSGMDEAVEKGQNQSTG